MANSETEGERVIQAILTIKASSTLTPQTNFKRDEVTHNLAKPIILLARRLEKSRRAIAPLCIRKGLAEQSALAHLQASLQMRFA